MKKQIKVKDILYLQLIVMIFSLSSVTAKFASGQKFMTGGFILFYGLEVVILAVYALLWQQAIKKFDISIAYANKAMVLLWGLFGGFCGALLFFMTVLRSEKFLESLLLSAGSSF